VSISLDFGISLDFVNMSSFTVNKISFVLTGYFSPRMPLQLCMLAGIHM
jgi:hypothetical protein